MDNYNKLSEQEKDVLRIQKLLYKNGINFTLEQAEKLWHDYSEKVWYASWECLPDDNKRLFKILKDYIDNPKKKQKYFLQLHKELYLEDLKMYKKTLKKN